MPLPEENDLWDALEKYKMLGASDDVIKPIRARYLKALGEYKLTVYDLEYTDKQTIALTPLQIAALRSDPEAIEYLLDLANGDNIIDVPLNTASPLIIAASKLDFTSCEILLNSRKIDLKLIYLGMTALQTALYCGEKMIGSENIATLLLPESSTINFADESWKIPTKSGTLLELLASAVLGKLKSIDNNSPVPFDNWISILINSNLLTFCKPMPFLYFFTTSGQQFHDYKDPYIPLINSVIAHASIIDLENETCNTRIDLLSFAIEKQNTHMVAALTRKDGFNVNKSVTNIPPIHRILAKKFDLAIPNLLIASKTFDTNCKYQEHTALQYALVNYNEHNRPFKKIIISLLQKTLLSDIKLHSQHFILKLGRSFTLNLESILLEAFLQPFSQENETLIELFIKKLFPIYTFSENEFSKDFVEKATGNRTFIQFFDEFLDALDTNSHAKHMLKKLYQQLFYVLLLHDRFNTLKILMKRDFDLKNLIISGKSPIDYTLSKHPYESVKDLIKLMLEHKVNLEHPDKFATEIAIKTKNLAFLELLLHHKASPDNTSKQENKSLLSLALEKQFYDAIPVLLNNGANPLKHEKPLTALQLLLNCELPVTREFIYLFLGKIPDINYHSENTATPPIAFSLLKALHDLHQNYPPSASVLNRINLYRQILSSVVHNPKFDVNVVYQNQTALHLAILEATFSGDCTIVSLILKFSPNTKSILKHALELNFPYLDILIPHHIAPNALDEMKLTPLYHAAIYQNWAAYELLLKYKADRLAVLPKNKMTLLQLAIKYCRHYMMEDLVMSGVDVNAVSGNFTTALTLAILQGDVYATEYLLIHGAQFDLTIPQDFGLRKKANFIEIYKEKNVSENSIARFRMCDLLDNHAGTTLLAQILLDLDSCLFFRKPILKNIYYQTVKTNPHALLHVYKQFLLRERKQPTDPFIWKMMFDSLKDLMGAYFSNKLATQRQVFAYNLYPILKELYQLQLAAQNQFFIGFIDLLNGLCLTTELDELTHSTWLSRMFYLPETEEKYRLTSDREATLLRFQAESDDVKQDLIAKELPQSGFIKGYQSYFAISKSELGSQYHLFLAKLQFIGFALTHSDWETSVFLPENFNLIIGDLNRSDLMALTKIICSFFINEHLFAVIPFSVFRPLSNDFSQLRIAIFKFINNSLLHSVADELMTYSLDEIKALEVGSKKNNCPPYSAFFKEFKGEAREKVTWIGNDEFVLMPR